MTNSSELARIKRLVTLCEVKRNLAEQTQTIAARMLEEAATLRQRGVEAVDLAAHEWQRTLESNALGPELSGTAGDMLIARAATLAVATQREARARSELASADEARAASEVRLRQVEALFSATRRKERHRLDQRALSLTEDRVMLRWGRT